ncbi:unnamed protein product [Didymodactylos carnosus]|uniref:Uncharacterized protein n=1 Tax=Didymodactylos carnosus TaxID=1234261 RepID=A0A8S2DDJ3_9BILA|nr:unnamed protein product [Didymodactylos carnosus]CAF3661408.1 unnamed protein product [Didymodactylos carnosus]
MYRDEKRTTTTTTDQRSRYSPRKRSRIRFRRHLSDDSSQESFYDSLNTKQNPMVQQTDSSKRNKNRPTQEQTYEFNDAFIGALKSYAEIKARHSTTSKQTTPISTRRRNLNDINERRHTIHSIGQDQLNTILQSTDMDRLVSQNPLASRLDHQQQAGVTQRIVNQNPLITTSISHQALQHDLMSPRSSETSEVLVYPSSISLRGLLSYQDVLSAIEREFHLHEGQEREIIMKLWLKIQTMVSLFHRYRYLLQDLSLDDKDFQGGLKSIREMIYFGNRDVHYLREQTARLEEQNKFLEEEFRRQLQKIHQDKNEQITRLRQIIDKACPPPDEFGDNATDLTHLSELMQRFMQQNVELQREIETLRAKLEYAFTLLHEKLDNNSATSNSVLQIAVEQCRQTEHQLQELKFKSSTQQEENDLLRYLADKSHNSVDVSQLFTIIEQRSLERETTRVKHELDVTEKKIAELERRFENADDNVQFSIERLKLKCDVLRSHIASCNKRLSEVVSRRLTQGNSNDLEQIFEQNENLRSSNTTDMLALQTELERLRAQNERLTNELVNSKRSTQLENELLSLRERYNEIAEYSNFELNKMKKLLQEEKEARILAERQMFETNSNEPRINLDMLENERRRSAQLEHELITLKMKYDDVCERITGATLQLERVQVVLDQTLKRCDQLEKEKQKYIPTNDDKSRVQYRIINGVCYHKN